jgi:RecB family endonuclease NucS
MILHYRKFDKQEDARTPSTQEENSLHEAIVANPPFLFDWVLILYLQESDDRFSQYGKFT